MRLIAVSVNVLQNTRSESDAKQGTDEVITKSFISLQLTKELMEKIKLE